jgi:hypothetical protein
MERVLKSLARVPHGSDLRPKIGVNGKENLLIELVGEGYINCRVWIGGDPRLDHAFDSDKGRPVMWPGPGDLGNLPALH